MKKGIIAETYTRNDVTGTKSDLLDFGKIFLYGLVQLKFSNRLDGD